MTKYTCNITLTILGPFLTAAPAPAAFGFDKSFHRDFRGRLVIPASHVKGKLRMAVEELDGIVEPDQSIAVEELFGNPSRAGSYEPWRGRLTFSDFAILESPPGGDDGKLTQKRTRTTINPTSGTAAEHQLRTFEDRFPSGKEITCTGEISFHAKNQAEADEIASLIRLGFVWLPNLGSEKGVGFGRVRYVQVGKPTARETDSNVDDAPESQEGLHLQITPLEPLATGGVQKQRTNFAEAESMIPGGTIKGALAASLNRAFEKPENRELSKDNAGEYPGYEKLVENFSDIRITHAFPAIAGNPRPVRMPISIVEVDGEKFDAALSSESPPMRGKRSPAYFIDWKKQEEYFGAASPEKIFITHTEIEDQSRRSLHGNLFTETYLSPVDKDGQSVEWICNVDFRKIKEDAQQETAHEFSRAVELIFDGLGRENRQVKVSPKPGYAAAAEGSGDLIRDGLVLVTLQSDALVLNPAEVRKLLPGQDLQELYAEFWNEISAASMQLVDFFALQSFKGGYLYHRYLGKLEKAEKPHQYRPYYLTNAGSLFKLKILDEEKAGKLLVSWSRQGLAWPNWANDEYGSLGRAAWKACPFTPENGYGEIAINLDWHWTNKV